MPGVSLWKIFFVSMQKDRRRDFNNKLIRSSDPRTFCHRVVAVVVDDEVVCGVVVIEGANMLLKMELFLVYFLTTLLFLLLLSVLHVKLIFIII